MRKKTKNQPGWLCFCWIKIKRGLFVEDPTYNICTYKMKNKKYNTAGTVPKSNIKIVERDTVDTPNTQIHNRSLSWLGTGTSIKSGGAKIVLWAQTSPPRERMKLPGLVVPDEDIFKVLANQTQELLAVSIFLQN